MVRDPGGPVASLLEVGRRGRACGQEPARYTVNALAAAKYVRRSVDAGFAAERSAPERVLRVQYESLVRNPAEGISRLCDFLEVAVNRQMERPGDREHLGAAAITVNSQGVWYDLETYYSHPNTDSIEKWRRQLSPRQQHTINRVFRNRAELLRMGYELGSPEGRWQGFLTSRIGVGLEAANSLRRRALSRRA